jgi:hypothetical protein
MKKLMVLSVILITISLGCVGKSTDNVQTNDGLSSDVVDNSWCSPDTFQSNGSEGFTLKGITEYNGSEVCEAEWNYDSGVATEYFTRDGNVTMVYKNVSNTDVSNSSLNNGSEEIPNTVDENITNDSNKLLINETVNNSS